MQRGPGVSAEATRWLYDRGVRVMGIDAWGWDRPLHLQAEEALAEYLIRVHQAKPIYDIHHNLDTYWVVTAWSDQPKRTAEEVVAVLLACAVEETRREQEARA